MSERKLIERRVPVAWWRFTGHDSIQGFRWTEDGQRKRMAVEIDNSAAERAFRAVALGRKNYLFCGSDGGHESAAVIYALLGTACLNGVDPERWLREALSRIADHPLSRIEEFQPWNLAAELQSTQFAFLVRPLAPLRGHYRGRAIASHRAVAADRRSFRIPASVP